MNKESLFIVLALLLGLLVGGGSGWLIAQPNPAASLDSSKPAAIPTGWKTVTLPDVGIRFIVRETDQIARLKHEDRQIGYQIHDPYASGGARVDIITKRIEEFYDRPEATTLAAYQEPMEGLTIQDSREATIHGHQAVKQLYTAMLGQKRPDGAILKRPNSNLLRYIFLGDNDQILLLKSSGTNQTFLDTVALSLEFISPDASLNDNSIQIDGQANVDVNPLPVNSDLLGKETPLTIE